MLSESACVQSIHGEAYMLLYTYTDVVCGVFVQGDFFIRQYLIQKFEQDKQRHC